MEKFLAVYFCVIAFAMFDYVGYNILPLIVWRIIQFLLQALIVWDLWMFFNFYAAGAFMLIWWGWICDFIYYWFYDHLKLYGGTHAGEAYKYDVKEGRVTWAWWTPVGLYYAIKTGHLQTILSERVLIKQASIMLGISFIIMWFT